MITPRTLVPAKLQFSDFKSRDNFNRGLQFLRILRQTNFSSRLITPTNFTSRELCKSIKFRPRGILYLIYDLLTNISFRENFQITNFSSREINFFLNFIFRETVMLELQFLRNFLSFTLGPANITIHELWFLRLFHSLTLDPSNIRLMNFIPRNVM